MAAMELFCHLVGINPSKLSREEVVLLEAELFIHVCFELKEFFRNQYKSYFRLMKFTIEKENAMLDANFLCLIIQDILSTEEYNLQGVAFYTDTPEDVVQEVFDGRNQSPSAAFLHRCMSLHRSVRRDLYRSIMKKIVAEYLVAA